MSDYLIKETLIENRIQLLFCTFQSYASTKIKTSKADHNYQKT